MAASGLTVDQVLKENQRLKQELKSLTEDREIIKLRLLAKFRELNEEIAATKHATEQAQIKIRYFTEQRNRANKNLTDMQCLPEAIETTMELNKSLLDEATSYSERATALEQLVLARMPGMVLGSTNSAFQVRVSRQDSSRRVGTDAGGAARPSLSGSDSTPSTPRESTSGSGSGGGGGGGGSGSSGGTSSSGGGGGGAAVSRVIDEDGLSILDRGHGRLEIRSGTVERLVEKLYSVEFGTSTYPIAFLMTYRSFLHPDQLLTMIIESFAKAEALPATESKICRLRMCNFLKRWLEDYGDDFSTAMREQAARFIKVSLVQLGDNGRMADSLNKAMSRIAADGGGGGGGGGKEPAPAAVFPVPPPTVLLPRRQAPFEFLDLEPLEFARQLTLIDHAIFRAIQPLECVKTAWMKENKLARAPNVLRMATSFNETSSLIAMCVLVEENAKRRVKVIENMIKTANHLCHDLHNYSGTQAILAGLIGSPIFRLKRTWEKVKPKWRHAMEELQALFSTNKASKAYRDMLKQTEPPLVPFMGIYLSDLVFIEEGNRDWLDNGYVNFAKWSLTAETVIFIGSYQQMPYNLTREPSIHEWILNSEYRQATEAERFRRSLELEPRVQPT